ncbi:hypothetical protein [Mangrovibacter sp. MFB070]|uniref:hypothetical protein n=1 Tax=Mangrovibacter sp. MFB070 TaxID=1224318 RepID=UPI0013638128|nr:hypothetical protein [Mangrovibacter sp. MFB070]
MATTPAFTHSLLTLPVSDQTEFTVLERHCEHQAGPLLECAIPLALPGKVVFNAKKRS